MQREEITKNKLANLKNLVQRLRMIAKNNNTWMTVIAYLEHNPEFVRSFGDDEVIIAFQWVTFDVTSLGNLRGIIDCKMTMRCFFLFQNALSWILIWQFVPLSVEWVLRDSSGAFDQALCRKLNTFNSFVQPSTISCCWSSFILSTRATASS